MSKTIGIIGGMGPAATNDLYQKIIENTPANFDQEHLHVIIDSNPQIPDRTKFILSELAKQSDNPINENLTQQILHDTQIDSSAKSPLPYLIASANFLMNSGVDVLAIACNSAHYFQETIKESVNVQFVSITDSVAEYIKEASINKVAILATDGTVCANIYGRSLDEFAIDYVYPSYPEQKMIMDIIYNYVKKGELKALSSKSEDVNKMIENFKSEGVQAVVLACTELPLAFSYLNKSGIEVIDSNEILAKALVQAS